jgi:hypothetical protein
MYFLLAGQGKKLTASVMTGVTQPSPEGVGPYQYTAQSHERLRKSQYSMPAPLHARLFFFFLFFFFFLAVFSWCFFFFFFFFFSFTFDGPPPLSLPRPPGPSARSKSALPHIKSGGAHAVARRGLCPRLPPALTAAHRPSRNLFRWQLPIIPKRMIFLIEGSTLNNIASPGQNTSTG